MFYVYFHIIRTKIIKTEHRMPKIELDTKAILPDLCKVLINTLK